MNFLSAAALAFTIATNTAPADPGMKSRPEVLAYVVPSSYQASPGGNPNYARIDPISIPERLLEDLQRDLDLQEFQAAAIVGNLAHETGNFRHLKEIDGHGYGYSQWSGSRRNDFFDFADEAGGKRSYAANYGFLIHELTGKYSKVLDRVRASQDLEGATNVFMKLFLAPRPATAAYPRRLAYAKAYLEGEFSGAGCLIRPKSDRIESCPDL